MKGLKILADFKPKEKAEGLFNGEQVKFNREWSGHRFSDDEVDKLLAGDEIEFDFKSKKGDDWHIVGKLAKQEYNGHEFYGFQPDFDDERSMKK